MADGIAGNIGAGAAEGKSWPGPPLAREITLGDTFGSRVYSMLSHPLRSPFHFRHRLIAHDVIDV
jgi:hypothetical protein